MNKSPKILIVEIKEYFQSKGVTTSAGISRLTSINQSCVHRNLFGSGKRKRVTKTLRSLCIYAHIGTSEYSDPSQSLILMNALKNVWDGTEENASQIASMLEAAKNI